MRKRFFRHGAEFNSGCGKAYILCNECCGIVLGRIGHKLTACVVEHDIMPLVINIDTAGFAHGKQHSLCLGILIHRMVEVKVILREVRERTDGKVYARNTVQNERMRGYLHDDMGTACVRHLTEKLLELVALRRCTLGVDKLITDHISVRADKADLCVKLRFKQVLDKIGQMPLPPYITKKLENKDRYNTIYSNEVGSAAAPTAGLHFTENVFAKLKEKGVDTAFVTLHVGLGTFRPVKEDNILDHKMHVEHYSIPQETADKIKECKARGGRVISVGTTSCRTLESAASLSPDGEICACSHDTGIFIYPGYEFKAIDGLITNFHLPESTLIMLVSAFLGREKTLHAYDVAIKEKYRFFSFGDSMIII